MAKSWQELKQRHRAERDSYSQNLSLRVHRALSWLNKAEQSEDLDSKFIFLWIAFNAAYANEFHDQRLFTETDRQQNYIQRLCDLDENKNLYELVWREFAQSIRILLNNPYIFQPFWDYHNQKITEGEWQTQFDNAKAAANRALGNNDTAKVLMIVLNRLYTLRNQLIHGGATWQGRANRDQLRDGVNILGKLVPICIELMMSNPQEVWGEPCYPVVA